MLALAQAICADNAIMIVPYDGVCMDYVKVGRDWLDYNDHMNVAFYLKAFDDASDKLTAVAGMGQAYTEARALYAGGLTTYLTVLTALNTRHQSQLNVLSAHRDLIDARIDLYEALGGPWTDSLSAGRGVER